MGVLGFSPPPPRTDGFAKGASISDLFSLFWPVRFFWPAVGFVLVILAPPWRPGPVFRALQCAVFSVGSFLAPALVPESIVARGAGRASTRQRSWIPFHGDLPAPCPCACKGGGGRLGFPGDAKPNHRDGYRRPGYPFAHPYCWRHGGDCILEYYGVVQPIRRNGADRCSGWIYLG